jgi:glycosyltransferase involved in cell wall biosynthesis
VTQFLRALAKLRERDRFEVDLAGAVGNIDQVTVTIGQLGLEKSVTVHGYVNQAALEDLLARADLAINLRYPSMSEDSVTQLRIWSNALPSLVTYTEGYADLPEEAVCFVRPEHEEADIQRHLLGFLANPQPYREKGAYGRKLLEREHSPETYVRDLDEITRVAGSLRQRRTKCKLADTIGRNIVPLGTSADRTAFYAETISALFD